MKLATALNERADLQRRLEQLKERLNQNAKVQEGDSPSEDPLALLRELDAMTARLQELISAINHTNARTVKDGRTITDMLAHRDCLNLKIKTLRAFLSSASNRVERYAHSEIKVYASVPVSELQKQVDALSAQLRLTDETIQELNWTTELI